MFLGIALVTEAHNKNASGGAVQPEDVDIERWFAAHTPPDTPSEAKAAFQAIAGWKRSSAIAMLGALMTEPRYQANTIRLDWLQRLVVSGAKGKFKPGASDIALVLNAALASANVTSLEDPIEDFFCDVVPTSMGDAEIFTGHWERASAYTYTMLQAFEGLPDARVKQNTLRSAHALLRLSNELVRRAGVTRFAYDVGDPGGVIRLPSTDFLRDWARRVRFSAAELEALGINRKEIAPFILGAEQCANVARERMGDSRLDLHPLVEVGADIVVAAPGSISLAVRGLLIYVAKAYGVEKAFMARLLEAQQDYSERTGFWPTLHLKMESGPHSLRACVCVFAPGRYLHVIQVAAPFDEFPEKAFGSVVDFDARANAFIGEDVTRFWDFIKEQEDYRESMTLILVGGWGTGFRLAPPIEDDKAPPGWRFMALSFAEAGTFGAVEDGKLRDLWRIAAQVERLEADGFTVQNINGTLNLFGLWRMTDGNILAEHWQDMRPPCFLTPPTDALFEPLSEAAENQDLRALRYLDGSNKTLQRLDWGSYVDRVPIYASLADIRERRLLGAVLVDGMPWWIACETQSEYAYHAWKAVLHWLAHVGPVLHELEPEACPAQPVLITLRLEMSDKLRSAYASAEFVADVDGTLIAEAEASTQIKLTAGDAWAFHIQAAENVAEAALVTRIIHEVSRLSGKPFAEGRAREIVDRAIPSKDWRWLHAHPALSPGDLLISSGLVDEFDEIPRSSVALVKCGHVWRFRKREDGSTISGEEACRAFLRAYLDDTRDGIIAEVKRYDRSLLAEAAARSYQAARKEQRSWNQSIRAMRTIAGDAAYKAAFERQNEINAVVRCSKVILELAACEAPASGGLVPGDEDMHELFARALLWFGNGQILACMRGGLVAPELRISPAGDLMADRGEVKKALHPAAEMFTKRMLDDAANSYGERHSVDEPEPSVPFQWDESLVEAMRAEYGLAGPDVMQLAYAVVDLTRERNTSVLVLRLSELANALRAQEPFEEVDLIPTLNRLTLRSRDAWTTIPDGHEERDYDVSRFDRPQSLICRPIPALDTADDPLLLIAPMLVSDALAYAFDGIRSGELQDNFWASDAARAFAGKQGDKEGKLFENRVGDAFEAHRFRTVRGRYVEGLLEEAVPEDLGDVDVLAISADESQVFVVEAKNVKFCRTESEVAARMSEFRGVMQKNAKGREKPDKMLKHLKRVRYLQQKAERLAAVLRLKATPKIRGVVIVDAPQPMNFHTLSAEGQDAEVWMLDNLTTLVGVLAEAN